MARVVVANTKKLRQISEAKQKTDRLDARRLAELLAVGLLAAVWCPDERTRGLRRLVARRAQLVRQRTRAKNELAAALLRKLLERPAVDDLAGTKGRQFLSRLELPADERTTVRAACARSRSSMRRSPWSTARSPKATLDSKEVRRLMSVPGVNLQTAATFMARVGKIDRFQDPRQRVS